MCCAGVHLMPPELVEGIGAGGSLAQIAIAAYVIRLHDRVKTLYRVCRRLNSRLRVVESRKCPKSVQFNDA